MVDRFFRGNPMFKPIEPVSLPPLAPRLGMFWSTQSCPKLGILLGAHQQPVLHQLSQWVQGILVDFIQELIVKNVREKTYTFPGQKKQEQWCPDVFFHKAPTEWEDLSCRSWLITNCGSCCSFTRAKVWTWTQRVWATLGAVSAKSAYVPTPWQNSTLSHSWWMDFRILIPAIS